MPRTKGQPRARRTRIAVAFLVLVVAAAGVRYSRDLGSVERLHPDEGLWILSGKLAYDLAFHHRDLAHPYWEHPLRTWGAANPQVGKYVLGFSVDTLAPRPTIPDYRRSLGSNYPPDEFSRLRIGDMLVTSAERVLGYSGQYEFSQSEAWNVAYGRTPGADLLRAARVPVVLAGLVAALLLAAIAWRIDGPLAAGVVVVLWVANPLVAKYSRVATTDMLVQAFVLAGTLGTVRLLGRPRLGRAARFALLAATAVAWGLAVATKMSALAPWMGAVGVALVASAAAVARGQRPSTDRVGAPPLAMSFAWLAGVVAIPVAVFVASNPFLHRHAFEPSLGQPTRFAVLFELGTLMRSYDIPGKIVTASDTVASLVEIALHHASISGTVAIPWAVEPVLFAVGLWAIARRLFGARGRLAEHADLLAFLAISLATWTATILWLPFDWPRLHIPLLPFYVLTSGVGLATLARGAGRLVGRLTRSGAAPNAGLRG